MLTRYNIEHKDFVSIIVYMVLDNMASFTCRFILRGSFRNQKRGFGLASELL